MSADDNAPEQAREVEVVARSLYAGAQIDGGEDQWPGFDADPGGRVLFEEDARAVLAALAPVRAAERQEAAREALLAAASALGRGPRGESVAFTTVKGEDGYVSLATQPIDEWLRDRADGVTGRSGT